MKPTVSARRRYAATKPSTASARTTPSGATRRGGSDGPPAGAHGADGQHEPEHHEQCSDEPGEERGARLPVGELGEGPDVEEHRGTERRRQQAADQVRAPADLAGGLRSRLDGLLRGSVRRHPVSPAVRMISPFWASCSAMNAPNSCASRHSIPKPAVPMNSSYSGLCTIPSR